MTELTQVAPAKPSNFDAHKPPEQALIEDCVHCGFCLPACPTYVLWGEEMDSPRGRIYMMKKSAQGEAPLDQRFQLHMDNCLGCMACMTACPSGVQYNKLIEDTRAQVERNIPRSTSDSFFRKLLFATFPFVKRLRLLALPMMIYQRSGLQKLLRATGLLRLLPARLAQMEALLPRVPTGFLRGLPAQVQPTTERRRRVGMLSGCVQQVFFQHVNQATARVLAAEGCEVIIPQSQQCCGALMLHSGLDEQAAGLANNDRGLRGGQRGHHRHQCRRLRFHHEGIRSSVARRSGVGCARRCPQCQMQRHLRDLVRIAGARDTPSSPYARCLP
jgi:glycolate oxidase iron-sulfur subunit